MYPSKTVRFIISSSYNFSLGTRFERTKPMKLIGDGKQDGVFPADIVYKSKTQLIRPLSPRTICEASKYKFIDGVQNPLRFDFDDIPRSHRHQYWVYLKLLPRLLRFVSNVTQFRQEYCGQSPKTSKPGVLSFIPRMMEDAAFWAFATLNHDGSPMPVLYDRHNRVYSKSIHTTFRQQQQAPC